MYFRQLKFYMLNYRSNSIQVMFYQLFYKMYIIKVQKEGVGGKAITRTAFEVQKR